MVKFMAKKNIFILIIITFYFIGCNIDVLGFIVSSDLDDRLKSKNDFVLLENKYSDSQSNEREWRDLNLGSPGSEYSFIVVTDTHLEDGKKFGFENFKKAVDDNDAKFVVHLGDATQYGSEEDVNNLVEIAESLGVPFFPAIGNHDFYFNNWHNWRDKIGSTSYIIEGKFTDESTGKSEAAATLFILDSGNSYFGKTQLDWLEREIKDATKGNVFVFTHAPLFIEGPFDMQQLTDIKERARVVSILKNKCDMMFMGHLHKNMYNKTGNVKYIGVASFIEDKAYCLVTVNGSNITYKNMKLK